MAFVDGQGFLFAKPMPAAEYEAQVRVRNTQQAAGAMSPDPNAPAPGDASQRGHAGSWTTQVRCNFTDILRRLSSVNHYLLIWLLRGSALLLPCPAWHLGAECLQREREDPAC